MAYQRNRAYGYTPYVPGTVTLNPSEDARVDQSSNTSNYGSDTTSPLRYFSSGPGGFGRQVYIKFNLSGYRFIDRAILRIYFNSVGTPNSVCVHESLNSSWAEGTITWDTAPGFAPGTIASVYVDTAGAYVEFDVTDYVAKKANSVISFTLRPSPLSNDTFNIDMSEGTNPPELVLEYGGVTGKLPNIPVRPNMRGFGVNFSPFNWDVYTVTNNNASGAGSFTDAMSRPNRVIIFETSGVFPWGNSNAYHSNIIVAAQTAPGPVIIDGDFEELHGSNVMLQYLTIWSSSTAVDGIGYGTNTDSVHQDNIVLDHVWVNFGRDECTDIWNKLANSGFHYDYCIIGPPATDLTSGRASLTGGDPEALMNVSFNKCIMPSAYERNPLFKTAVGVANNCMLYNWGALPIYVSQRELNHTTETSILGCFFAEGPDTTQSKGVVLDSNSWESGSKVYLNGNVYEGLTITNEWDDLVNENGITDAQSLTALTVYDGIETIDGSLVEADVIANAGPRASDRFPELAALIAGISARTGTFVTANGGVPAAVPTLTPGSITHTVPSNTVLNARGYTPLQMWLEELAENPPVSGGGGGGSDWTPEAWGTGTSSSPTPSAGDTVFTIEGTGDQVPFFAYGGLSFPVLKMAIDDGDFDFKVRIDSMVAAGGASQGSVIADLWAGIGFIAGDTNLHPMVLATYRQENGSAFLARKSRRTSLGDGSSTGPVLQDDSAGESGLYPGNRWLHIVRTGNSISCYLSSDGVTTTEIGSATVENNLDVAGYLFMFASDGSNSDGVTSVFSNPTIT